MRLTQMQDVGGCAILPSMDAVQEVLAGIKRNWDVVTVDNYVDEPRTSGYRAIHVITRKDGLAIELQLRTPGQQTWADEIERIDSVTDYALKDEEGPEHVLAYTRKLAEIISLLDAGTSVQPSDLTALATLRQGVP